MITIENAQTPQGMRTTFQVNCPESQTIDASELMLFPGLIDPHVHFRTPGMEHKEDWRTAANAAIRGGYTTVFDMPNTIPPTFTAELLAEKKRLIDGQLQEAGIPLRYHLFFGADKNHLDQIPLVKNQIIGIKVFMGCSTGNLVIDDDESLHAVFAIAAQHDLIVAVHAEDEASIKANKAAMPHACHYPDHSRLRNVEVATRAVEKAIMLSKTYGTRLYLLHVSSADEITLIKQAKEAKLNVYAETTPHHLFLNDGAYQHLHGKAQVNPPLRDHTHQPALFQAIRDGIIDTIGSDHAPHTEEEKAKPFGECPSGMPGIETTLPLLLTAHHQGLLTLDQIVSLTCTRARSIFRLPENGDKVLVDMNKSAVVTNQQLATKCRWSPYAGQVLRGWPIYTILRDKIFCL